MNAFNRIMRKACAQFNAVLPHNFHLKIMERIVIHSDLNNFYASVERRLRPELCGVPLAVGGNKEERKGIVLAKSEEAKRFGVKTGEALWQAKKKCPDLVVVPPNFPEYMKFSRMARAIYAEYTDLIEPYGIDECWLDVTHSTKIFRPFDGEMYAGEGEERHFNPEYLKFIGDELRGRIKSELGLTVSVGVSFNKVFAKLGSDMKKPDAVTVIPKESFKEIVWDLPASDMLGIGRATEKKLSSVGIYTIGQIAQFPVDFFQRRLGKCGVDIWRFANGLDNSQVIVRDIEVPDKTVGHGMTAVQDLESPAEVWKFMLELCQDIGHRLFVFNKKATGIAIAIRDKNLFTKQW